MRFGRPGGPKKTSLNQDHGLANHEKPPVETSHEIRRLANFRDGLPPFPENENPGARAGATGANSKADELRCLEYAKPDPLATLARLRSQHLARVCGLTDCRAATIAALYFAGCAS